MKKKNLLFSFLIVTGMSAFAQTSTSVAQIPANVRTTFQGLYPNATNVTWEQEEGFFIPVFTDNGAVTKVLIDAKGKRVQSSVKTATTQLPAAAATYISSNYPGKTISDVQKLSMFNYSTRFEAVVGGTDLVFDETGNFITLGRGPLKQ
jgi:hypothetical protein